MHVPSLYDLTFDQLRTRLESDGVRPVHAEPLWYALYQQLATDLACCSDFPPPLQRWLVANELTTVRLPEISAEIPSADGLTQKLLLRLADGQEIETVIMGYPGRYTACLSTQAGCAMGCVFCATGQMGFVRHLTPAEIVTQVVMARRWLQSQGRSGLRNLVMMGMGEPLHNYDATMQALAIITDSRGLKIGPSRVSVSTVGVVPGIRRFAAERQPYHLAVSLHAATDEERSALLPSNRRWPLAELLEACRHYSQATGRKIIFAWTLIAGRNDTPADADRVAALLQGMPAHLNLIRLNTTAGFTGETAGDEGAAAFHRRILAAGIPCTMRQRRGLDVDAGCGQLRATKTARRAQAAGVARVGG